MAQKGMYWRMFEMQLKGIMEGEPEAAPVYGGQA
jgi:hypothetical protein